MIVKDRRVLTSMYCRKCGYALVGLSEDRCPECGQHFDPANPRTFQRYPRGWFLRLWLRRLAWGPLVLVVLSAASLVVTIAVLHSRWKAQDRAIAAVQRAGGRAVITRSTCAPLVLLFGYRTNSGLSDQVGPGTYGPGLLGTRSAHLNDRVYHVYLVGNASAPDSDSWTDLPVDDAAMDELRGFVYANVITICSQDVTDAGLEKLRELPGPVHVSIRSPRVTATGNDMRWPDRPNVRVMKMGERRIPPAALPAPALQRGPQDASRRHTAGQGLPADAAGRAW